MRKSCVVILLMAGCTPLARHDSAVDDRQPAGQIREARRIVVESGGWGHLSGTEWTRWTLEADGKCRYESTKRPRMPPIGGPAEESKSFDLPPTAFAEARRLLLESKIWTVKQERQPEFEAGAWFSVEWEGQKRSYNFYPEASKRLLEYLESLAPAEMRRAG
jgi:hypothetical protein